MTRAAPQSQPYHRSASAAVSTSSSSSRQQQNQHSNPSSPSSSSSTKMMKTAFHRHASTGGIISGSGSSVGGGSSGRSISNSRRQTKAAKPNAAATTTTCPTSTPHSPSIFAEVTKKNSSTIPTPENDNVTTTTAKLLLQSFASILISPLYLLQWLYHHILKRIGIFHDCSRGSNGEMNNDTHSNKKIVVDNDVIKALLLHRKKAISTTENENGIYNDDDDNNGVVNEEGNHQADDLFDSSDNDEFLRVKASPGLTALLDNELYRAYKAELLPTVASASQLISEFIEMKETSALILRECRWMVGIPFSEGMSLCKLKRSNNVDSTQHDGEEEEEDEVVAVGGALLHDVFIGEGSVVDKKGMPAVDYLRTDSVTTSEAVAEAMHSEDIANWNEFDTIQDFAQQCYLAAKEAIHRLTTDRLADSANLTLQDFLIATSDGMHETKAVGTVHTDSGGASSSLLTLQSISQPSKTLTSTMPPLPLSSSAVDNSIGRVYQTQRRRDCWESPRLYCPDYSWADDAIGGCQRLLKTLSKHRFVALVNNHGWDRYSSTKRRVLVSRQSSSEVCQSIMHAPTHASCAPHVFPSLETIHAMQYLVSELLLISIPSLLNQFRAATESNSVVSKRLYLVKCEYRAPLRALWESCINLNAAPRAEMVERYLRECHGVKVAERNGAESGFKGGRWAAARVGGIISEGEQGRGVVGKSLSGRRRSTLDSTEVTKKSVLQQRREKLETLITEKYWKHPTFIEALQLERCCEQLEMEMSQMLLPLANLASEIMTNMKGRLRAVVVVNNAASGQDAGVNSLFAGTIGLRWHDVPYMRELLRRLESILRRKPDLHESLGIRPLLLDLQGVPRHNQDLIDLSMEIPFYPPLSRIDHKWFHLDQFISEVDKLLHLLKIPNTPFVVKERIPGIKGEKTTLHDLIEQCTKVWDEELFSAWYKDWFDMVTRQQELNAGANDTRSTVDERLHHEEPTSLSELSEIVREAEIELSIATASKDQLERVYARINALHADKAARYKVLTQIVFDVGYRELSRCILVDSPPDDEVIEYPQLSVPGVFGDQLTLSGEFLPIG